MIKLGLLGTDSTHATHFANIAHPRNGGFPDVRFTHVFGIDPAETAAVAESGEIANIVADPAEMIGAVDGIMMVFRHGDLHMRYAMPFIEAGVPMWIDKPFTVDNGEARQMLTAAAQCKTLLTGCSTYKYAKFLDVIRAELQSGRLGEIYSVVMDYNIFLDSPYGGLHFYASHLIEMCCELFGFDMRSVQAWRKNGNLLVRPDYRDVDVLLNYTKYCNEHFAVVIGEKGSISVPIDFIHDTYNKAFAVFIDMIKTGEVPFDPENMYKVTAITNAIGQAMETGEAVEIVY